ncbi:MAG: DEAD/DEAH box helicase [Desulfurococcus sp.]|nr:DEAD/DEAH box helicase [Desulfurococcus sp.]
MVYLRVWRWLSDSEFRELLKISDYTGFRDGYKIFSINAEKALRNGYSFDDVAGLIRDLECEIEGSLEELKKAFEEYALTLDWDSVKGHLVLHVHRSLYPRLKPILAELNARRSSETPESLIYRIPPLNLPRLAEHAGRLGIPVRDPLRLLEEKKLPLKPELRGVELRDYQREALQKWIENKYQGIIALPTGSGKTLIGVAAIIERGVRSLIVVYTKEQMIQWRNTLLKYTSIPEAAVGVFHSEEKRVAPVTITTYQSGFRRINSISPFFDMLIIDEVHHLPADKFKYIAIHSIARYRMGLSATPYREDGRHEDLFPLLGSVVYYKAPGDLVATGYLAPYRIVTVKVKLTEDERREYESLRRKYRSLAGLRSFEQVVKDARVDPAAREALRIHSRIQGLLASAKAKIDKAVEIALRELEKGGKIIVFTQFIDQAKEISEKLNAYMLTGEVPVQERKRILEEFRKLEKGVLVVTTVGDEGLDIPDADVGIVVSGTGSRRQFIQRLGRLLRPKTDGREAVLYEIILEKTSEEYQARKRRNMSLNGVLDEKHD